MALTTVLGRTLALPTKDGGALAPIPLPVIAAPEYVPVGAPVPPNPVTAPPPPVQFRGAGGTPFLITSGARSPAVYSPAIIPTYKPFLYDVPDTAAYNPNAPAVPLPVAKAPAGTKANVPVPVVVPPSKVPVPATQTPTQAPPGPVSGNVGGFDLSRVPLWAWLVGAAVVGSRFLR